MDRIYHDEGQRKAAARQRDAARRVRKGMKPRRPSPVLVIPVEVPANVLAERDATRMLWDQTELTPNMVVLGDPPVWRSALVARA